MKNIRAINFKIFKQKKTKIFNGIKSDGNCYLNDSDISTIEYYIKRPAETEKKARIKVSRDLKKFAKKKKMRTLKKSFDLYNDSKSKYVKYFKKEKKNSMKGIKEKNLIFKFSDI